MHKVVDKLIRNVWIQLHNVMIDTNGVDVLMVGQKYVIEKSDNQSAYYCV